MPNLVKSIVTLVGKILDLTLNTYSVASSHIIGRDDTFRQVRIYL